MDKEQFKKKILEQQIFNELKDSAMTGCGYIKGKYEGMDIDFSRLYRRIVNYQVKKYGYSLTTDRRKYSGMSKEEAKKITERRNHRKAYWRNYEHKKQRKEDNK